MKTRITSLTAVTILLASIVTLAVPEEALAMPGPADNIGAIAVEQFSQNTYTVLPDLNFAQPHAGTLFVTEHSVPIPTSLAFDGQVICEPFIVSGTGMVWALVDSTGVLAVYEVDVGESLTVTFKDGVTAATPVAMGNTLANMLSGTGPYVWVEYLGPLAPVNDGVITTGLTIPQLATLGAFWGFYTCGVDGVNDPNPQAAQQQETFSVELPVGGEIISINTSALVIAGLMTNGMMLVPILGAAATAGTVFTVLRHLRKED